MLLDNKTKFADQKHSTVYEFINSKTETASLDIVTGYFSIVLLARLKTEINKPDRYRLILGDLLNGKEAENPTIEDNV